jgi:hypothetical protein
MRSRWWLRDVNPNGGDCCASTAIRCCFVDTPSGSCAPALFPPNDSATRRLRPSTGFRGLVPRSPRYHETLRFPKDLLAALRLCFAWRYHPASPVFVSPLRPDDGGLGPGTFGTGCPTPADVEMEPLGVPSSWGTLLCLCRVLRPRRDRLHQAIAAGRRGPRSQASQGLSRELLSRLHSTA